MLYKIIGVTIAVILVTHFFDLTGPIKTLFDRLADVPQFTSKGEKSHLFDLAVRLAYLIAAVGVIKLLVMRRPDDE